MSDPQAVRAEWSAGDYPSIARRVAPAAESLVDAVGAARGMDVLDVATGTGNTALRAARRGARVVGVDLTPELLAVARDTATAEGLEVDFLEGDAEALEFEEDRFDRVLSTFGVVFAPRPAVAAGELSRVCTPGGMIGLTAWPGDGLPAAIKARAREHLPGRPGDDAPPPAAAWATEERVRELFAPRGVEVRVERRTDLRWRFAGVDEAAAFAVDTMGGLRAAIAAAGDAGLADALVAGMRDLFAEWCVPEAGGIALPMDYLLVTGVKTG
jgi:SAM-dependent methyltransferase